MTKEQIERYEELRDAKRGLETLINATQEEGFAGFAAAIKLKVLTYEKVHRYATSKYLVENMIMFLKAELSRVNHLIERI